MWTWSIAANGKKQDVVDLVTAHEPPTVDAASVDIDEKGKCSQKVCAALYGLDAVPSEAAALRAANLSKGGKVSDVIEAPSYVPDDVDLPDTHASHFNKAKAEVLKMLENYPDDKHVAISVSGNDELYKLTITDFDGKVRTMERNA